MKLEVQRYLRAGRSLENLAVDYAIRSKVCDPLGVAVLNYNQIASPMQKRICQECRALILELESWNVVSRSFSKFFNYGEPNAHEIDWTTAVVLDKIDGSLICFYYHAGAWRIATKGTADASGPVNSHNLTFAELVRQTLQEMGIEFAEFIALLNPDVYYTFELTAPENRVIVPYAVRQLAWLAAWDAKTLEEIDLATMDDLPAPRVREHPLQTLAEVLEAVGQIGPLAGEGFIVRDARFRRLKIKSASYLMVDRVLCSLTTPRRKMEVVMSEGFDDIVAMVPDRVRNELVEIKNQLSDFRQVVLEDFRPLQQLTDRKNFAVAALPHRHSAMLFWMRDGLTVDEAIRKSNPDKLVEWLGLKQDAVALE